MRGARWRREGINLSPNITVVAVELINEVVPLLKATQCLVQCEELGLARATVATSKVPPTLHEQWEGRQSEI